MLKKGNQKGFTLIEIIAVLVILGILAAVAIPKYLSMADEARIKAAQGAIAEIKGRLSSAQAKYMMANGGNAPTSPAVVYVCNRRQRIRQRGQSGQCRGRFCRHCHDRDADRPLGDLRWGCSPGDPRRGHFHCGR